MEKKEVILGFKKLKKRINLVNDTTKYEDHLLVTYIIKERTLYIIQGDEETVKHCNDKILIISENRTRLMLETLEKSLNNGIDLNVNNHTPKLNIWDIPIYVTTKDDVVMLINSLGGLHKDFLNIDFWAKEQKGCGFHISAEEFRTLKAELPDSSKLRSVLPEEMI